MRILKRSVLWAVLFILLISLYGCAEKHTTEPESTEPEPYEIESFEIEPSYVENAEELPNAVAIGDLVFFDLPTADEGYEYYENEIQGYESYKEDILKQTGLDKDGEEIVAIVTKQVEKGKLTAENESTAMIFDVKIRDASLPYHIPVLVIDNNGKMIYEVLSSGYSSTFYLRDIDGDGYAEIVTQCCVAMSGGAGGYDSSVYTLKNNNLSLIYCYDYESTATGFKLTLSDGYNHTISNEYTPFITTFVRDKYLNPYFDENSNITDTAKDYNDSDGSLGDSFFMFEPFDIDNDGVYEILTAQYCSLYGHADGMGTLYSVLKYDKGLKTMSVAKAGFWRYQDVGEDERERYYDEWADYENSWYKT